MTSKNVGSPDADVATPTSHSMLGAVVWHHGSVGDVLAVNSSGRTVLRSIGFRSYRPKTFEASKPEVMISGRPLGEDARQSRSGSAWSSSSDRSRWLMIKSSEFSTGTAVTTAETTPGLKGVGTRVTFDPETLETRGFRHEGPRGRANRLGTSTIAKLHFWAFENFLYFTV